MKITTKTDQSKMTISLEGWLDTKAAPELENILIGIPSEITDIVFDCSALEYISSSGIRQIIAAYKQMNGNLTMKDVPEEIMSVLNMTGLSKRIKME